MATSPTAALYLSNVRRDEDIGGGHADMRRQNEQKLSLLTGLK